MVYLFVFSLDLSLISANLSRKNQMAQFKYVYETFDGDSGINIYAASREEADTQVKEKYPDEEFFLIEKYDLDGNLLAYW